jgi:alpha-galactosidase
MPYRITIIGGGSSIFTPQLISLFIKSDVFQGSSIMLMDIDPHRLEVMETLGRLLVEKTGARLKIEGTTNRRDALVGTDFVIAAISVGGYDAWEKDLEIPARYGIYQPIGDSVGPGGIMRAFRHVIPLVEVCKDLQEVAPNAILFNYTNPATVLCRAMRRESMINAVSICTNGVYVRDADFLAGWVGVEPEELALPPMAAGINHCACIPELRFRDGRDAIPVILEQTDHPVIRWCLDTYGVLPIAWPHWTEFFPSICRLDDTYAGRLQNLNMMYDNPVHDLKIERDVIKEWEALVGRWLRGEEEVCLEDIPEIEPVQVVEVMEAIALNRNEVHVLNLPNRGAIDNLPNEAIVEVSTLVNRYGMNPVHVGPLPEALAAHLRHHLAVQELTLEAALTGDRRIARQAFELDPFVAGRLTIEEAKSLLDEMLQAHAAYLPQFR